MPRFSTTMSKTPCLSCHRIQPIQAYSPPLICTTAIQWSQNHQTHIEIINVAFDTPIIVGNMLHIKDHYRRYQIYGKVTKLTVMLQTCFIFEVSLTQIPSEESTIFITVPINNAVRAEHMALFQSFVNELQTLPDLLYPYSLMATEFKPQVPSIYATYILCIFSLYSASKQILTGIAIGINRSLMYNTLVVH